MLKLNPQIKLPEHLVLQVTKNIFFKFVIDFQFVLLGPINLGLSRNTSHWKILSNWDKHNSASHLMDNSAEAEVATQGKPLLSHQE